MTAQRVLFVLARTQDLHSVAKTAATVNADGGRVTVLTGVRGDEAEVAQAVRALGITDHRWLGGAGARWPGREPRRYLAAGADMQTGWLESLEAADAGEIAADIAAVIDDVKPDVVVTHGRNAVDADQARIEHATQAATEVMGVPFYTIEGTDRFRRARTGALRFRDYGLFSRIVTCLVAAALGAFAGALLTAVNQASVTIAGVPVPWGVIAAVLITIGLLAGLRLVFGSRLVAACAAAGLLIVAAIFALRSAGGSLLVFDNPAGYIWTFAPLVIGAAVLLWPRIRASAAR